MKDNRPNVFRKWATMAGAFLVTLTLGFPAYWVNMSVYTLSFIVTRLHQTTGIHTPWILHIQLPVLATGVLGGGLLSSRIGKKATLGCGIVLTSSGMFVAYFAVQSSLPLLTFALAGIHGIGIGLSTAITVQLAADWAGKFMGLMTAIVRSATNFGGIIISQYVTSYVNPNNLTPDLYIGDSKFFSQPDVVDRVPTMILILASSCFSLQLVGFLMMSEKKVAMDKHENLPLSVTNCETRQRFTYQNSSRTDHAKPDPHFGSDCIPDEITDMTPLQMVRTREFYIVSISMMLNSVTVSFIKSDYKAYGQIFIHNDFYLTAVANVEILYEAIGVLAWGAMIDRFRVSNCLLLYNSVVPVLTLLVYFSPMIDQWMFFIAITTLGGIGLPVNSVYTPTALKIFGKTHFCTNMGVLMFALIPINFIWLPIFDTVFSHFGWFSVFATASSLNVLAMFWVILSSWGIDLP